MPIVIFRLSEQELKSLKKMVELDYAQPLEHKILKESIILQDNATNENLLNNISQLR